MDRGSGIAAIWLCGLLAGGPAAAQGAVEHASLSIKGEAAAGCVEADALGAAIDRRVGAAVFGSGEEAAALTLDVHITREHGELRAQLTTRDRAAGSEGTRALSARDCAGLQEALELVIALTLAARETDDADDAGAPASPTEDQDGNGTNAAAGAADDAGGDAVKAAAPPTPAPATSEPPRRPRPPPARHQLSARASGGAGAGLVHGIGPLLALGLAWYPPHDWYAPARWPLLLSAHYAPGTRARRGGVSADVDALAVDLLGCPVDFARRTLLLCAGLRAARVHAQGRDGLSSAQSAQRLALHGLLQADASLPIAGPLALHARLGAGLALTRPRFVFAGPLGDQFPIFQVPSALFEAAAGISVALF